MSKRCAHCGEDKPLEQFYVQRSGRISSWCKVCQRARSAQRWADRHDEMRDLGPFDRYFAELVCVDMAGGITRGGRWVHVERALIVPW